MNNTDRYPHEWAQEHPDEWDELCRIAVAFPVNYEPVVAELAARGIPARLDVFAPGTWAITCPTEDPARTVCLVTDDGPGGERASLDENPGPWCVYLYDNIGGYGSDRLVAGADDYDGLATAIRAAYHDELEGSDGWIAR